MERDLFGGTCSEEPQLGFLGALLELLKNCGLCFLQGGQQIRLSLEAYFLYRLVIFLKTFIISDVSVALVFKKCVNAQQGDGLVHGLKAKGH